jgi:hypothetical protein
MRLLGKGEGGGLRQREGGWERERGAAGAGGEAMGERREGEERGKVLLQGEGGRERGELRQGEGEGELRQGETGSRGCGREESEQEGGGGVGG